MPSKKAAKAEGAILVTGATGFLGGYVVEALRRAEPRRAIRGLARGQADVSHDLELVTGDVCERDDVVRAMQGVSEVYHLAGSAPRDIPYGGEPFRTHVEGTRNVLTAAADAGVRRVVVVTTSGTVAVSRDVGAVSNEASPYRTSTVLHWPYYLSKIYQEQTAFRLGEELKLDVVVVGPSLLLGPGAEVSVQRLPLVPKGGGIAFVDVRDAAQACVLAMQHGKKGERYLVSAANMPLAAFAGRLARLSGQASPREVTSPGVVRTGAKLVDALFRYAGRPSPLDPHALEMAECSWFVDASKAAGELGWTHREAQQTLVDTVLHRE